jgi:hypothetical protein
MRKIITPLLLIALTGCHVNKSLEYNNKMVKIVQQILVKINEEDTINTSLQKDKLETIQHLKEITDSSINAINVLTPEKEAENFHTKARAIFLLVKEEYIPLTAKWVEFREKATNSNKENDNEEEQFIEHYRSIQERLKTLQFETMVAQNNFVTRTNVEGNVLYLKGN